MSTQNGTIPQVIYRGGSCRSLTQFTRWTYASHAFVDLRFYLLGLRLVRRVSCACGRCESPTAAVAVAVGTAPRRSPCSTFAAPSPRGTLSATTACA